VQHGRALVDSMVRRRARRTIRIARSQAGHGALSREQADAVCKGSGGATAHDTCGLQW
jgi:hypothetical protein